MNKKKKRNSPAGFGAYVVDGGGVAVRCFEEKAAAFRWLDKHFPGLGPDERSRRVWTFGSRSQVSRFFKRQIDLGCADADVLSILTYYCGVATRRGFDLKNGRAEPLSAEAKTAEARRHDRGAAKKTANGGKTA